MDPWIVVFAVIAAISLVGWLANAILWYRHPTEDTSQLRQELLDKTKEVEDLITEVRDALGKVVAGLPEVTRTEVTGEVRDYDALQQLKENPEAYFAKRARSRDYGFYPVTKQ